MYKLKSIVLIWVLAVFAINVNGNTVSYTYTTVCDGDSTHFVSTSTASKGTIILQEWDFDGDSIFETSGSSTFFKFDSAGTYNVLLKVTTDSGFVGYTSNPVSVNPNPVVAFSAFGNCLGEVTQFTSNVTISNGSIVLYQWELNGNGDFADASGPNPIYNFNTTGFFNVGLNAVSDRGCETQITNTISIDHKPKANFTAQNVCDGKAVSILNSTVSLGPAVSYTWHFGDGNTSNQTEPNNTYAGSGSYTVKLVAENTAGCKDSLSRQVEVYPNPVASFTTTDVCIGQTTEIENTSNYFNQGASNNYWTFGDGTSTFNLNSSLSKTFDESGVYTLTLSVVTSNGCTDTVSGTTTVNALPVYPIVPQSSTEFCAGAEVVLEVFPDSGVTALWSNGEFSNSITANQSGVYEVVFFTIQGCEYQTSEKVLVHEGSPLSISSDTTIEIGVSIMLKVEGSVFYTWGNLEDVSQMNNQMVEVSPSTKTTYTVNAVNEHGCKSATEVTVDVTSGYNLVPSNLMTPDGNGKNDFFYVENIDRYPECEVQIFNSYGKQIYSQKAYANDFDGTVNGDKLPEGTYYYVISCDGNRDNFSGAITILRINE
jgi:gliding motility-associated-like protein